MSFVTPGHWRASHGGAFSEKPNPLSRHRMKPAPVRVDSFGVKRIACKAVSSARWYFLSCFLSSHTTN